MAGNGYPYPRPPPNPHPYTHPYPSPTSSWQGRGQRGRARGWGIVRGRARARGRGRVGFWVGGRGHANDQATAIRKPYAFRFKQGGYIFKRGRGRGTYQARSRWAPAPRGARPHPVLKSTNLTWTPATAKLTNMNGKSISEMASHPQTQAASQGSQSLVASITGVQPVRHYDASGPQKNRLLIRRQIISAAKTMTRLTKASRTKSYIQARAAPPLQNDTRLTSVNYCPSFNTTGICRKHNCSMLHNPDKVALCKSFLLKQKCENPTCHLAHVIDKDRTPHCQFFLHGACANDDCPFLHVKVRDGGGTCENFNNGYCPKGQHCSLVHAWANNTHMKQRNGQVFTSLDQGIKKMLKERAKGHEDLKHRKTKEKEFSQEPLTTTIHSRPGGDEYDEEGEAIYLQLPPPIYADKQYEEVSIRTNPPTNASSKAEDDWIKFMPDCLNPNVDTNDILEHQRDSATHTQELLTHNPVHSYTDIVVIDLTDC